MNINKQNDSELESNKLPTVTDEEMEQLAHSMHEIQEKNKMPKEVQKILDEHSSEKK